MPQMYIETVTVGARKAFGEVYGTVSESPEFDAKLTCTNLRKAMEGPGTDKKAIIAALVGINNKQRQELSYTYNELFGRNLVQDLKSELSGNLEKVIFALLRPKELYDAIELRAAMKGLGTDEDCLIEILASRNNEQIAHIKKVYKEDLSQEGRDLEKDLESETSSHLKHLLKRLVQGNRDESDKSNMYEAKICTQLLQEAGVARWGTDESTFINILCTESFPQLQLISQDYQSRTGKSLKSAIEEEFSGDVKNGLLAILQCSTDRTGYFVDRLHKAMKGLGTDDSTLIRILTSRSEIDLKTIKKSFKEKYGKSLTKWVKDDTSGDYRDCLLALIKRPSDRPAIDQPGTCLPGSGALIRQTSLIH